jgi:large subunit ribosomal protein L24
MKTRKKILRKTAVGSKILRTGDQVISIAGDHRGQIGTILSLKGVNVIVRGLNVHKRHVKPTEGQPKGGVVERELPIHVSNLRLCVEGKPVKLKTRTTTDGKRELFYMNGDAAVSYRQIKKSSNA